MSWKPDRALALGIAVLACAVGVDIVTNLRVTGYFGLSALLVSAARGPRRTAAVGALAFVTAAASGLWNHDLLGMQHVAGMVLVAAQAAVAVWIAVHRTRREHELRHRESELARVRAVADVAQRALLPAVPTTIDGACFAARYLSAAEEATVGGDLYEVVPTRHTIRVIIGDVRGKGLPAVRLASVVLGAFREAAVTWLEPEQVAAACARAVDREADSEDFVTALLLDIHADGRLSLCSAGHHPPMLLPAGTIMLAAEGQGGGRPTAATTMTLTSPSPPLGIADRFSPSAARWEVGDRLLLFTDGLIEARSPNGDFFPLAQHLDALRDGTPEEALDRLTALVTEHAGGHLRDDLAMLLIERRLLPQDAAVPRQLTARHGVGAPPAVDGGPDGDGRRTAPDGPVATTGWRRLIGGRAHRPA
jgi:serine phosphatase RsbU (regulator of sigma subunit)